MSWRAIKDNGHTIPSPTDCAVLAHVYVLTNDGMPTVAVSDDGGMGFIAKELAIPFITSLDLVHRMFTLRTRTVTQIKAIAGYLDYQDDLPRNWRDDGNRFFGIELP
ncbi:hypothetical protein [Collimonas antrihumi]|uniref:hypothetical protein n=1 Tax=Collimonas antrihumi TaxID=1940615 RepID=UPI001B8D90E8|nr:hypothetical protein [Collimonas antrihumi]